MNDDQQRPAWLIDRDDEGVDGLRMVGHGADDESPGERFERECRDAGLDPVLVRALRPDVPWPWRE